MASETDSAEISSLFERLLRQGDGVSVFVPFIFGFTSRQSQQDPDQEPSPRERTILMNPFARSMVVLEGGLDPLISGPWNTEKEGQSPASKAAVEAMPRVEIRSGDCGDGACVICLEDWVEGDVAAEMPCKHRFHGKCIEEWLGIHGTCPICRYEMPVDGEEEAKKRERRGEREIWVSLSFNSSNRRSEEDGFDQNQAQDSATDDSGSSPRHDQETEE